MVDGDLDRRRESDTYIDVAVEEPRAWVVSLEANADLRTPNTDDVAARGIDKVSGPVHALDDVEGMAMEMDGVDCGL